MQLYLEGIDFLHIFVAIRFGRQVVAVVIKFYLLILSSLSVRMASFFMQEMKAIISIYIGKFYLLGINFFIVVANIF